MTAPAKHTRGGRATTDGSQAHVIGLVPSEPVPLARLVTRINEIVSDRVRALWVVGEITQLRRDREGHWHLELRDEDTVVECVWWRRHGKDPIAALECGQRIVAYVLPTVFTRRLSIPCVIRDVRLVGDGAVKQGREDLRTRLNREGLMSPRRKRSLPRIPRRVGVITSRGGAAWHDVQAIATERHPGVELLLIHADVQGVAAPASIARAFELIATSGTCDVVILTRGGGSAADLSAFDDERVARAIAGCPVPVVAAIGHETDVSIADAVADVRVATPTAAATRVVPCREELIAILRAREQELTRALQRRLEKRRAHCDRASVDIARLSLLRITNARRRTDRAQSDLADRLHRRLPAARHRVDQQRATLQRHLEGRVNRAAVRGERCAVQLHALNPRAILGRGYAIARTRSGVVLSSVTDVVRDQPFELILRDGTIAVVALSEVALTAPSPN